MRKMTISQPPQGNYQSRSDTPLPSSPTTPTTPAPVMSERPQRAPDRPPSWLARPYEPSAKPESGPRLRNAKSTSALGAAAREEKGAAKAGVTRPNAAEAGATPRTLRSKRSLKSIRSIGDVKKAMSTFRRAKPSASTGSLDGGAASVEESPDDVINLETGLTRRDADAARLDAQKASEAAEQASYEKFLQLPKAERDLRTDLIKAEKIEDMIEHAIEQNGKAIARDKSFKGKLSGVVSSAERKEHEEHKRLEGFSHDQWREKLLGEKGEPEVTREDIIALMQQPELATKVFDFSIRTGRADPVGAFKYGLKQREEEYERRTDAAATHRAALQERRANKAPDPYAIPDDSSEEETAPVVTLDLTPPKAASIASGMTFDSAQAEDGSVTGSSR